MRWRREVLGCALGGALIVVSLSASAQPDERPPGEAEPQPPPARTEPPPSTPPPPQPPPPQPPPPQPPPQPQQPPAYPYGYPPPGYPQGYPPPGYPPPGYPPPGYPPPGYPPPGYPPPGYPPPGYYAYPPTTPVKKKPRYPDDSAAQTSPFFDLLVAGVNEEHRFTHFLTFGISAGVFLGGIVRIAPQISMFASEPDDSLAEEGAFTDSATLPEGFQAQAADSPAILWGGAVGFAVVSRESFVLSPGVLALRTDVDAYGTFLGLHAPFEWVSSDGARVGFAVAFGRSFGGSVRAQCFESFSPPNCDPGEVRDFDREAGSAFYAHFQLGWGLNHPDPLPAATP